MYLIGTVVFMILFTVLYFTVDEKLMRAFGVEEEELFSMADVVGWWFLALAVLICSLCWPVVLFFTFMVGVVILGGKIEREEGMSRSVVLGGFLLMILYTVAGILLAIYNKFI